MEKIRVLVVCSGGMSSAIAMNALVAEAKKHDVEVTAEAVGNLEFEAELKKGWDVALVAPQIRHQYKDLEKLANDAGIPVALIKPQAYSPLGGAKMFEQVKELLE